jgi:hypothetical protein
MKKIFLALFVFVLLFSTQSFAQDSADTNKYQEKVNWTKEEKAIAEKVDERLSLSKVIDNYYGKKDIKLTDNQKKQVNNIAQEELKTWLTDNKDSFQGMTKEQLIKENKKLRKAIIQKTNKHVLTEKQQVELRKAKKAAKKERSKE